MFHLLIEALSLLIQVVREVREGLVSQVVNVL